jgi:hypothetical protein
MLSAVSLYPPVYETCFVHHGTWTDLNGVLHKSVSVCVCMCIPLSLPGNSSVNTFPWRRRFLYCPYRIKRESVGLSVCSMSLLGNGSVNTFPQQRRVVGGVVSYVVCVASKERRQLVLTWTYWLNLYLQQHLIVYMYYNNFICLYNEWHYLRNWYYFIIKSFFILILAGLKTMNITSVHEFRKDENQWVWVFECNFVNSNIVRTNITYCNVCIEIYHRLLRGGLISLWLYKENNKLQDWKKCIYSTYSPLSSTHLWLLCSNFFNPSKKNSFGCAANMKIGNRKSQGLINTHTYVN